MDATCPFGHWLKQRRKSLDLTQAELAHRINCTTSLLQKIESGERRPSQQIAELLAQALDVAPERRTAFIVSARGGSALALRPPTNLPAPTTPLIGREGDVAQVRDRLMRDDTRLVTLVGPPGIGKTRLSLAVAAEVRDHFDDGVFFVSLAPIADPDLVVSTIVQTLGLKETARRSSIDQLAGLLRDKCLLLVLDNFEQVIEAAPVVAKLLDACALLKAFVTSRIALRLRAERQFPVSPLALPDLRQLPSIDRLVQTPAIALFIDRVEAVKPDFAITDTNAAAIATICHRLEGLPLAIELIAAHLAYMSPHSLLDQLHGNLLLRSDSLRDLDTRQKTLFNAIDWSYNLLRRDEQTLFARLGVFVGGWTLGAVEVVCGIGGAVNGLASLVNKSLIVRQRQAHEVRFTMLEMIREYALERLKTNGETQAIKQRHADYFLAMTEEAEPHLIGPAQMLWLNRLERDQDNLRAALDWLLECVDLDMAARLCAALRHFWVIHGHLSEGRRSAERVLNHPDAKTRLTAANTVNLLNAAGCLAYYHGDYAAAHSHFEESLTLARSIDDKHGEAFALDGLGAEAANQDDRARALTFARQSLALSQAIGDRWLSAITLITLGELARLDGNYDQATQLCEQSLALLHQIGDKWFISIVLHNLGQVAQYQGRLVHARAIHVECLNLCEELGNYRGVAMCLEQFAGVAGLLCKYERAARLLGAAQALRDATHTAVETGTLDCLDYARAVRVARAGLSEVSFHTAWALGRSMMPEQAITYALERETGSLADQDVER